jgi:hypothetical protein
MTSAPYVVTRLTIAATVPRVIRGDTKFAALLTASVSLTAVEISFGQSDSWQPLMLGVAIVDLVGIDRVSIRSSIGQVITVATGSAMVYDSRAAPTSGTIAMSVVDVGGAGLGQEAMAASIPVVIASDQNVLDVEGTGAAGSLLAAAGNPLLAAGSDGTNSRTILTDATGRQVAVGGAADGAAIAGAGNPVLIAGQDGTNIQSLKTDTTGRQELAGGIAAGSAISTLAPVLVGGSDGTNVQRVKVDTAGNQVAVGAVAAGSAVGTTAPVMVAGTDGTNVQRIAVIADNVATPAAGNQTAIPGVYQSTARALTSARAAFLSIDRGGKVLTTPCGTLDPALAGYTVTTLDVAAGTNAAFIKASAGMVYEVHAFNAAAYAVFLRLYNKASTPTVGTDVAYRTIMVPAGGHAVVTYPGGAYFATGIAYATTKLAAYNDATALVAHDLQFSIQTA